MPDAQFVGTQSSPRVSDARFIPGTGRRRRSFWLKPIAGCMSRRKSITNDAMKLCVFLWTNEWLADEGNRLQSRQAPSWLNGGGADGLSAKRFAVAICARIWG